MEHGDEAGSGTIREARDEMIPSVEKRSVRPCYSENDSCAFLNDNTHECKIDVSRSKTRMKDPGNLPCKYNIFQDELKEALDSGTMYNKIFIFLKMGEEKKVESDIAIQEYPEYDLGVAKSAVNALNKGNGLNKFYIGNKNGPLEYSGDHNL